MPSYRLRTRRAVEALTGGLPRMRARLAADMAAAAAATDFERAGELKQQLTRLDALAGPAFTHVADARRWNAALVLPSPGSRRSRVLLLAGGHAAVAGEIGADHGAGELEPLARRLIEGARAAPPLTGTPAQIDTLAAVTRWLLSAGTRRRGSLVRIDEGADPGSLGAELAASAAALRKTRAISAPDQIIEA